MFLTFCPPPLLKIYQLNCDNVIERKVYKTISTKNHGYPNTSLNQNVPIISTKKARTRYFDKMKFQTVKKGEKKS